MLNKEKAQLALNESVRVAKMSLKVTCIQYMPGHWATAGMKASRGLTHTEIIAAITAIKKKIKKKTKQDSWVSLITAHRHSRIQGYWNNPSQHEYVYTVISRLFCQFQGIFILAF